MPKSDNQKGKILYILEYLHRRSDREHPVTALQLAQMLEDRYGIRCDRKTVLSDIHTLQEAGADIIALPGRNGGYYLASRDFELPELKLLLGAVQSSRFLTEKKSRELIRKLTGLCSEYDAQVLLGRDMLVSGRVKSMNETIYYNVDAIQEAIAANRQIRFRYFDWDLTRQRVYRNRDYTASPYSLCQNDENCYLLALSPRHGITAYRVDRMADIALLDDARLPCPELTGAALTAHAGRLFQMYAGETKEVKLRFHRRLVNAVIDRFGREVLLIPDGEEHFVCTVQVAVSPMFLSWVIGFGDQAKILHPQSVIESCQALCRQALEQYSSD